MTTVTCYNWPRSLCSSWPACPSSWPCHSTWPPPYCTSGNRSEPVERLAPPIVLWRSQLLHIHTPVKITKRDNRLYTVQASLEDIDRKTRQTHPHRLTGHHIWWRRTCHVHGYRGGHTVACPGTTSIQGGRWCCCWTTCRGWRSGYTPLSRSSKVGNQLRLSTSLLQS